MTLSGGRPLMGGDVNALGQATLIKTEGKVVAGRCGKVRQAVVHLKDKSRSHQGARGHRWIASLQPPESVTADEKTGGHVAGGDAALPPRGGRSRPSCGAPERRARASNLFYVMAVVLCIADIKPSNVFFTGR